MTQARDKRTEHAWDPAARSPEFISRLAHYNAEVFSGHLQATGKKLGGSDSIA